MKFINRFLIVLALVLWPGFIAGMARTDEQILNTVQDVSYEVFKPDTGENTVEFWRGQLPDGQVLTIFVNVNGPRAGVLGMHKSVNLRNNFNTQQMRQKALDYLKEKYNQQETTSKLTQ